MKHRYSSEDTIEGICTCCGEKVTGEWMDQGIGSYEYWGARGTDHDWQCLSPCCEDVIAEVGGVLVDETTTHTARKNHTDQWDRVIVRAGQKYRRRYLHSWYVDEHGKHHGIVNIEKQVLDQ